MTESDVTATSSAKRPPWVLLIIAGVLVIAVVVALLVVFMRNAPVVTAHAPSVSPSASPSRSATPQITPTAEPAPVPETPPAIGEIVLTEDGLGDITMGQDLTTTNPETSVVRFEEIDCGGDYRVSAWVSRFEGESFGVGVRAEDNVLRAVQVTSPEIRTDRDLRVGMTVEELLAAYPEVQYFRQETGWADRYGFDTTAGAMDFWVRKDGQGEGAGLIAAIYLASVPAAQLGSPPYHPLGAVCL